MKFTELGLEEDILKAVLDNGYDEPTPIQAETIPDVLAGKDIIGQAQTGTGKTAAFGLPILQNVDLDNPNIQAIIVSPTRELAAQTQAEIFKLGKYKRAKVQVVYGGADIRRQINALKSHPQIVVGTPGRLLDHIGRHTIRLDHVKTLVLDEADDMLDMGFLPDIEKIIEQTPSERQTLLFSATMPAPIKKIGVKFMTDPKQVTVKSKELTARTGRAGAHGTSVTFVTNWEMDYLRDVERLTKKRLLPLKPPTEEEAFIGRAAMAEQNVQELVKKTDVDKFGEQADRLLEQYDARTLVAALLNDETKADASEIKVKITPERPLPRKKSGNHKSGGYRGGRRHGGGNGYRRNGNGGKWNDRKNGHRRDRDDRHAGSNHRQDNNKGGNKRHFVIKEK